MPSKAKTELYEIERSPFYRMGRQKDLAFLLGFDLKAIKRLARDRYHQYWRKDLDIGGKARSIVCPFRRMRDVHERIQALCNRIKQPSYLHSPRRGHTTAGNAEIHRLSRVIAKLDIRQFYPSTTTEHVYRFFLYRMRMTDDVAGLMARLCTVDGRLPFSSPLSPVLCTLVHRDLFDQISAHSRANSLKMSLWVDDITISGDRVPAGFIWTIKGIIRARGLKYHKVRVRVGRLGVVLTGYYLRLGAVAAANKHHLSVRDGLAQLDATTDPVKRLKLVQSLIGKTNYARQIYGPGSAVRSRLDKRWNWLHAERERLRLRPFITKPVKAPSAGSRDDLSVPWSSPTEQLHTSYLAALEATCPSVGIEPPS